MKAKTNFLRWTFKRALKNYGSLYLACNDRKAFFTSSDQSRYTLWSCQNVCDALSYLIDNIYIRFGTKLYRQIVGIPMGTNCASLVADVFLYCYERDFMDSLNHDNQADVIEAFNSTSRYVDDLLNIDKKVQVGKDQENAQSEKDSHSKNRGGEKTKLTIRYLYHETYRKPNEQLFSQ